MEKISEVCGHEKIVKCNTCHQVFQSGKIHETECLAQLPKINWKGNLIRHHEIDDQFDVNEWISAIYLVSTSWERTFWRFVLYGN